MVAQTPCNSQKLWAKVAGGWLAAKPWIVYASFCGPWGAGHREESRDGGGVLRTDSYLASLARVGTSDDENIL